MHKIVYLYLYGFIVCFLQVLDHTVDDNQKVAVCSVSVMSDLQTFKLNLAEAEDYIGKCVDVLINCAGMFT